MFSSSIVLLPFSFLFVNALYNIFWWYVQRKIEKTFPVNLVLQKKKGLNTGTSKLPETQIRIRLETASDWQWYTLFSFAIYYTYHTLTPYLKLINFAEFFSCGKLLTAWKTFEDGGPYLSHLYFHSLRQVTVCLRSLDSFYIVLYIKLTLWNGSRPLYIQKLEIVYSFNRTKCISVRISWEKKI